MRKLKSLVLAVMGLLCCMSVSAHDFEVDGIYYDIISSTDKTVAVTYQGNSSSSYSNEYYGEVKIPESVTYSGDTYSVTSIGNYAFFNCSILTSVEIGNSVTSIGEFAFYDCRSLTSVEIPNSVTSIGNSAFSDCLRLTSVEIPNSVTSIGGYAFLGTAWYNNQPDGVIYAGKVLYRYKETMPANTSITITIEDGTVSISPSAFYGCSRLTSVEIPNSVTSIGDGAFYDCLRLTSVEIPNSVTSIGYKAFSGCSSLTSIVVAPNNAKYDSRDNCNAIIESESNTLIAGCMNSTIPNSVTSIGEYAFYDCSSLTSVVIGNGVTSIGEYAFYDCSSLTSVVIGNGVTSIGVYAFYDCSELRTVINNSNLGITRGDTRHGYVAYYAYRVFSGENVNGFYFDEINGKNVLTGHLSDELNLTLPESYNGQVYKIGDSAFRNCSSLTSVEIPNSVTSIGHEAFSGCSSLTSVEIPNSVTSIGHEAFSGCSNLTNIVLGSSVNSIASNAFVDSPLRTIVSKSEDPATFTGSSLLFSNYTYIHAPLYVPEDAYWNYAYANGWGDFIHIKEMVTDVSSLQSRKAYMIADSKGCNYKVYDAEKDEMKTVEYTHSLDEESEDCCWTVITENGKTYLYNLGAKKFGVVNDEGALTLSETPVNVTISENENGLSINGANCMFVLNKNVEVEITGINDVLLNGADTKNAQIHSLDGRRQTHVTRGINIVNGKKVLVK